MLPIHLFLRHFGSGIPRQGWELRYPIRMQRLYFIRGGTGWYQDGHSVRCPFVPGNVYLLPYNLRAVLTSDPADPVRHCFFDFLSTPPILSPDPIVIPANENSPLRSAFDTFEAFLDGRAAAALSAEQRGVVHEMLQLFMMLLNDVCPLPFSRDRVVIESVDYIHEQYASPLTVSVLAERAGFAEHYFIRRFRESMGITPYAYLRSYRLLRAHELIAQGCTAARAAELVGYENASSLSRAMRTLNASARTGR